MNHEYGENKKIIITNDDYTHFILLNISIPVLKNKLKQNVIGLVFELSRYLQLTKQFIMYAQKYIGKYFIGEKGNLPEHFIEGFGYM